ncbi:hypothetical protein BC828DRAFT_385099 [Blastocladiella britannica]|nr:hypothetical protein BC828DRAFT_385099 [Blastocladiella britannica]
MDILLPDELLVRVSTYLDLSAILALRASSRCLVNLTQIMLEHDPSTGALLAIVTNGKAKSADAIIRASKNDSLVRRVVYRLVCRPHRNRRYLLRLDTLSKIICDLVHHCEYGLDTDGFVGLLYGVFKMSPPMALHLQALIGLTGPGWMLGVVADKGSAEGYALEMYMGLWIISCLIS